VTTATCLLSAEEDDDDNFMIRANVFYLSNLASLIT
jgi:hypothetical protein